jgi:hypothetical protein
MNEYEQPGTSYYPSEGRIEEFPISAGMMTPRQEEDSDESALVVKANTRFWALENDNP